MTRRRAIQPDTEAGVFGVNDLLSVRASVGARSTASGLLLIGAGPLLSWAVSGVGDAFVSSHPTVAAQENSNIFACELRGPMRD